MKTARQIGDIHPNGIWVWTEYKTGKFDWRKQPEVGTMHFGTLKGGVFVEDAKAEEPEVAPEVVPEVKVEAVVHEGTDIRSIVSKKEYSTDYKKKFFKDAYAPYEIKDNEELLKEIIRSDNDVWRMLCNMKTSMKWETVKKETLESGFENDRPGYVGIMSGDLKVTYKGTFEIDGKLYYRIWNHSISTKGFW